MNRSYQQACSVALFLDQLGGRWTLLIVRDLLIGPRRYKDLLAGLPGIGTNLLTDRLQELQELEIIEKLESTSGRNSAYVLTKVGQELEPIILAMANWGLSNIQSDTSDMKHRADLLVVVLRALFNENLAVGLTESYQFILDDLRFYLHINNGVLKSALGVIEKPAFTFISSERNFNRFADGVITLTEGIELDIIKLEGSMHAFKRFQHIFSR